MFLKDVRMENIIFQFVITIQRNMHEHDGQSKARSDQDNDTKAQQGFVGHAGCDKNGVLLQTARANVLSIDESAEVSTRILFDSGSQRTYISEKVRNALKLKTLRTEKVIIKTFGQSETSVVQNLEVVQFKVRSKCEKGFMHVEALCVPTTDLNNTGSRIQYIIFLLIKF